MKENFEHLSDEGTLENGLPLPFVESMRTLFDILDDQHTGRVKFAEIERRWHEDEDCSSSGLPAGVLDSLRVVTPPDGYLSFTRFCKGLQICLLRSKSGNPGLLPSTNINSLNQTDRNGIVNYNRPRSGPPHNKEEETPPPLPPPPLPSPPQAKYSSVYSNRHHPRLRPNYGGLDQVMHNLATHRASLYEDTTAYKDLRAASKNGRLSGDPLKPIDSVSHYNNSNNINIASAQSKSLQNGYGSGSKSASSSPRKSSVTSSVSSRNAKISYGTLHKADIKMGTGGVMSIYDSKPAKLKTNPPNNGTGGQGPPKPPRVGEPSHEPVTKKSNGNSLPQQHANGSRVDSIVSKMEALTSNYGSTGYSSSGSNANEKIYDRVVKLRTGHPSNSSLGLPQQPPSRPALPLPNIYSLQRSQTHSHIITSSLDRDTREGRKAGQSGASRQRPRRGGSLERLLDGPSMYPPHHHSRESSTDTTASLHFYPSSRASGVTPPQLTPPHSSGHRLAAKYSSGSSLEEGPHLLPPPRNANGTGGRWAVPQYSPPDQRLTMSSYAWIRGNAGEEASSDADVRSSVAHTAPKEGENNGPSVSKRKARRRDARRHTLQNGLDFAAVKRASQLEAERDMLHQGLQVVEEARQWYRQQLHKLTNTLSDNDLGQFNSEREQQKLHYQLARISEINTQLNALMNASELPQHLALATSSSLDPSKVETQVKRLKDQNHQLTEEVGNKSQQIAALEQDKSRLLRELFQARTIHAAAAAPSSQAMADSTFM